MKKYKVVFFGTPEFSVPSLMVLKENASIEISHVVSMPDRPAGRGKKLQSPAVIDYAKEVGIPYFQTANINKESEFLSQLEKENIDFFVVIAFAQFLGTKLLRLPRLGAFNIHTSLLPKYRGAAPIQYALLNGDKMTGVSIQKMVKKMDAGDIVYSHEVEITPIETSDLLFKKLEGEAAKGLNNFIRELINSNEELKFTHQNEEDATFAPTINKLDGLINPAATTAVDIFNKYRAYYPWPGIFLYFGDHIRLKITKLSIADDNNIPAGTFNYKNGSLLLGTKMGSVHLENVQLDGKKSICDKDFINTIKSKKINLLLDRSVYA